MGARAGFITIVGEFTTRAVLSLLGLDFLVAKGETLFYLTVFYSVYL